MSRTLISKEKLSQLRGKEDYKNRELGECSLAQAASSKTIAQQPESGEITWQVLLLTLKNERIPAKKHRHFYGWCMHAMPATRVDNPHSLGTPKSVLNKIMIQNIWHLTDTLRTLWHASLSRRIGPNCDEPLHSNNVLHSSEHNLCTSNALQNTYKMNTSCQVQYSAIDLHSKEYEFSMNDILMLCNKWFSNFLPFSYHVFKKIVHAHNIQ